jgi:hypothetical protein
MQRHDNLPKNLEVTGLPRGFESPSSHSESSRRSIGSAAMLAVGAKVGAKTGEFFELTTTLRAEEPLAVVPSQRLVRTRMPSARKHRYQCVENTFGSTGRASMLVNTCISGVTRIQHGTVATTP